ncbi:MAG: amidohydrolase [Planctomycetes bacterium]|nr:amidohydrolase [Planctomycetota bacterium]
MIVDCYTHFWKSPGQVGLDRDGNRGWPTLPPTSDGGVTTIDASPDRHLAACEPVDKTFVLGFESAYLDVSIPNDQVADYVRMHPGKLIGFAGVDPTAASEAVEAVIRAHDELGMRGLALAPAAQDFHPSASRACAIYEAAIEMGLPILFHSGPHFAPRCKLEYARPLLLDEVAREYPTLKIIIAHLGYPWIDETLVLLAKHANVYSDISRLLQQPWQAYQALLSAYQYGVIDRLLFGSGFPYTSAANCIEALYSINHLVQGTNLPTIPREALRSIVERDALGLLGIETAADEPARPKDRQLLAEEN